MPDEELDNLIRDAASQHHPPYDDKAWGKMEVLLDKHMPQKKDRKKLLFFFLLFLLVGSAVYYAVENTSQKSLNAAKPKSTQESDYSKTSKNNSAGTTTSPDKNNFTSTDGAENINEKIPVTDNTSIANDAPVITNNAAGDNFITSTKNKKTIRNNKKGRFSIKVKQPETFTANEAGDKAETTTDNLSNEKIEQEIEITNAPVEKVETITEVLPEPITADSVKNTNADKLTAATPKLSLSKKNKNKGFANKFSVTLSAGKEISYITINNTGKAQRIYGAGASYAISKRFTVSSGIYIADKIYTAKPGQYKFASGSYNPALIKIDANCKVYEIPVLVRYNFRQLKNHNWFAGLGISSYLMKKEGYNYVYKNASGQTWSYLHKVNDKNKNYLSVLTISGGYQYFIHRRFAFLAEPFLKLAVKGVGEGKVKLNNAGIMVTAAIKPFGR